MNFQRMNPGELHIPEASVPEGREGVCPDCDGYGNLIENGVARPCHCRIDRELRERLEVARIPERYRDCSLDNFTTDTPQRKSDLKHVREILDKMVNNPGTGLYLAGLHGTGKTHLAVGVMRELIRKDRTAAYFNVVDMLDSLRDMISGEGTGPGGKRLLGFHMRMHVLLLDDLGVQRASPWVLERLHAIVNARYEKRRALIVTSNFPLEQLMQTISRATVSRLREMCVEYTLTELNDYRRRPGQKKEESDDAADVPGTPDKPRRGGRQKSAPPE